jgi:hypothetical protein
LGEGDCSYCLSKVAALLLRHLEKRAQGGLLFIKNGIDRFNCVLKVCFDWQVCFDWRVCFDGNEIPGDPVAGTEDLRKKAHN